MFRNDYQRDESKEGHREVGEKGDEVKARESVPELIEAGYLTQTKNDGVEKEMEKADHGDMEEEVYVQGWEETLDDSRFAALLQPPPSEPFGPTDVQAGDSQPEESSCDVIAQNILLHAKLVLCDGHRIVDGQRRDAKHLSAGDIFIEAVHGNAHLKMHLYLEREITTVRLDHFLLSSGLEIGVKLLPESEANQIWELAFCSGNYVPTTDAGVLDSHVCPVFSRQWIEQQGLVFEEVITAERHRVIKTLDEKLPHAEVKARETQNSGEARHIMALHDLVAERAHSFIDMHAKFAVKNLAVFETPRLGNCVAFTLHWLKFGALPDLQYRDDEGQNTPGGLAIVRVQRESVSRRWQDNRHKRPIQQVFELCVEPPTPFEAPQSSSSSS